MSSNTTNNKYNTINYKLLNLEDQEYLFANRYFKQQLLPYEENKERKV